MNAGLLLKSLRETWGLTLLFAAILMAVEGMLSYVLPTFQAQFTAQMAQMPFFQNIIRAIVGAEVADRMGPELFASLGWVHPVVLTLVWAHAILFCTRIPAGEVERGTIDVLMSLPVSRTTVLLSETAVWMAGGAVLLGSAAAGCAIGSAFVDPAVRQDPADVARIIVNLYALYLCAGGLAWFVSSWNDRRGRALTTVFVVLLVSFLVNYLAQVWAPAQKVVWTSILDYYRPAAIIRAGAFPWRDVGVLLVAGGAMWGAGGLIFSRRDLATL